MKTLIQIIFAFVLLTGAVQAGRAAVKHYSFVDAVQEAMIFASSRTEEQIADKVLELAGEYEIPLDPDKVMVERQPYQINIEAPYTDKVNLLPGVYTRTWNFDTSVHVRLLEDTRPRRPVPPGKKPVRVR
jgi:hypothetical protein